jgi:aromatic ring-opening dioxygenase catalytic subunit (LigB family)
MAEIVAAFGVPHTPAFPEHVLTNPNCIEAKLFAEVAKHLEAVKPDVIVIFDSDHFNTFFLDNLPTFAIGVTDKTKGPNDETNMPTYQVPINETLAGHVHKHGIVTGFDFSLTQEFEIDHSILVPLHFLTPLMNIPIVPIFINGLVPPLPAARRCFSLGKMVKEAIALWPEDMRVAVVASGAWALEAGGPRMHAGEGIFGVPDPEWFKRIMRHMEKAEIEELLESATSHQLAKAGNVGGELLNWISLLGMLGPRRPVFLETQAELGLGYAAWRWDVKEN